MTLPSPRWLRPLVAAGLCAALPSAHAAAAAPHMSTSSTPARQDGWHVGDRVEAYNAGWYNATITEIGSGSMAGYYKVHYDNYSSASDQYLRASSIRARQGTDRALTATDDAHAAAAWHPGDRVLAYNVDWYPATVLEVGTGQMAGYVKVHYDAFSTASDQFLRATNVKARPDGRAAAASASAARAAGPRLGRYRILSFGAAGAAPITLGEIELMAGGRYRTILPGGRVAGEGRYAYDTGTAGVHWLSGPLRENRWGGAFTVEREGRTHQLRLRGGTVAVNSVGG